MKFYFRKIASVIASAVMLSSTVALAAAANYPAPFVKNGAADLAVVYGANAAQTDLVAAIDITAGLQAELAKQTATTTATGATTSGGDSVKFESGSTKLHIGSMLNDTKGGNIGSDDMPNLLAKKTYQAKDGSNYDYEQYLKIGPGSQYGVFTDVDYNSQIPTLGIKRSMGSAILNYTLSFSKTVESSVNTATQRMSDIENTDITILGKNYKLLNAYNATNIKLELMGGAVSDTLAMDESKDYTIGDKTFTVKVTYVGQTGSTNEAKMEVNGEMTNKMNIGGTQKLKDGTQLGVRDIMYQSFAGGVMKVEFSLGAEKLTLENGQKLKLNDNSINDVVVSIAEGSATSTKPRTISKIVLSWITNDKTFITEEKSAVFPGLNSVTFKIANFTTAKEPEEVLVTNSGDKTLQIKLPVKSGTATIPVLTLNSSKTGFNIDGKVGGDSTPGNLVTSSGSSIQFNRTSDQNFVASWSSGTDAESYLLRVTNVQRDYPSTGMNTTDIVDSVTGNTVCKEKKSGTGDSCQVGPNILLNINTVIAVGDGIVNMTGGSGVNFNRVYTPGRLMVWLPVIMDGPATATNRLPINMTAGMNTSFITYNYLMEEADRNNNIGAGRDINFTVGVSSSKITVSTLTDTGFSGGDKFDVGGTSTTSKYVAYLMSDVGTKLIYDAKPDQHTLSVYYNGGESIANVFLTAPETTVTSGVSGTTGTGVVKIGKVAVSDAEAASVATKNLIVVGGSCINSVAASLLGGALCGADFEASTGVGAGSFLIQTFSRDGGKVATLVAGYNAEDTTNAATYLTTQVVDTSIGKKYKGTSATSAQLVVATSGNTTA
jgi:hypothetical protein